MVGFQLLKPPLRCLPQVTKRKLTKAKKRKVAPLGNIMHSPPSVNRFQARRRHCHPFPPKLVLKYRPSLSRPPLRRQRVQTRWFFGGNRMGDGTAVDYVDGKIIRNFHLS